MGRNYFFFAALTAVLSVPVLWAFAATAWVEPSDTLLLPHINGTGQTVSAALELQLQHDVPCTISVHVNSAGGEILTGPAPSYTQLTTSYKFTGGSLLAQDADWISSDVFRTRIYSVTTTGPTTDSFFLSVQGQAPSGHAIAAGDYKTNGLALVVTWP